MNLTRVRPNPAQPKDLEGKGSEKTTWTISQNTRISEEKYDLLMRVIAGQ